LNGGFYLIADCFAIFFHFVSISWELTLPFECDIFTPGHQEEEILENG